MIAKNFQKGNKMVEPKKKERKQGVRGRIKAEMSNPIGRPRTRLEDLDPNWKEIMLAEAQEGGGPTAYMVKLGIGTHALETLLTDSECFRSTYEACLLLCKYWHENVGKDMMRGAPGNSAVWSMAMANRFNWKTKSEISGNSEAPLKVDHTVQNKPLTGEELRQELIRRGLPVDILEE